MNQEVNGASRRDGRSERLGIGGVGDDEPGAGLVGGCPELGLATCRQDDVVAELCESPATRLTDATAATGDQCSSQRRPPIRNPCGGAVVPHRAAQIRRDTRWCNALATRMAERGNGPTVFAYSIG